MTEEEKKAQLDQSLSSWWKEYAARKNDEDQEHVADSLLYDERCHLPRTAPPPTLSDGSTPAGPTTAPTVTAAEPKKD
ncbi:hypothetical protein PLESTM_001120200 [Pleodorina starrii]|nr:hypothetical protein PLESTM_001120200 [Pleodorina starrii]